MSAASEKHTVHCRDGGKVVICGDEVEIHLAGPIKVRRQHWIRYFPPCEEVRRTMTGGTATRRVEHMLEEAFGAVPMVVYPDD